MNKNINMAQGSPLKLLLVFAIPLMLGNIFQQLYTVVDTAIVGQGVGLEALAALGCVDWLNWMFVGMAQGLTQGFSVRVAQVYGKQDFEKLKKVVGQSATLSFIIAILFTIISLLGVDLFLDILRVPFELKEMSKTYVSILFGGFSAVMLYNYSSSVLRALGDSKTPLLSMVISSITNILLDILFVFYFKWGIAGAAIATVIAQILSGLICLFKMLSLNEIKLEWEHFKYDSFMIEDLIRMGTPIGLKNVIIALGGIYVQSVANGFSLSFIAGYTATNKLFGVLEIAAASYGYAVTTYVGQNYGANKMDRIESGMKSALILSFVTSLIIGSIMILFGENIVLLFISSDTIELMNQAVYHAYTFLCIMSIFLPFLYMLYAYQAGLQGLGNTKINVTTGLIELVIRLVIATISGYIYFENGIFYAEVFAWVGSFIYLMASYYKTMRRVHGS